MRTRLAWLALLVLGLAAGPLRAQPAPFRAACAALPATRPASLVLRHAIHTYSSPEALVRYTLHDASVPCPADEMPGHLLTTYAPRICVPLSSLAFDGLYATVVAQRAASIRVRAASPAPHSAGVSATFVWSGHECEIGDVLHVLEIHPDDAAAFRAIDAALRALEAPPLGGS